MVTAWLPLVDTPPTAGTLLYATGSHLSPESSPSFEQEAVRAEHRVAGGGPVRAGDVCFHAGWTIHSAGPNTSAATREAVAVCFVAKGAALYSPEQRKKHEVCEFASRFDRRAAN